MKIGVVIPTCNRSTLLSRTVASVLCQSLPATEIVVVNDGQEPVVLSAPKLKVINTNGPRGQMFARPAGVKVLSSDIEAVCYIDDDDVMLPEHLSLLSQSIKNGHAFAFSTGLHQYPNGQATLDPEPENTGPKRYYDPTALLEQNIAPSCCFMHTMQAYQDVGGWDEQCLRIEDWDLWGRMFIRYGPPGKIEQTTTVVYKGSGTNLSDSNLYNYSMACSWRDIVADRLKCMASEKRYRISDEDRKRFHVPRIGIPLVFTMEEGLRDQLNCIIAQETDFEVMVTVPDRSKMADMVWSMSQRDKRIRMFVKPEGTKFLDMMNWSLLVSRSEYLAMVEGLLPDTKILSRKMAFLDEHRNVGVLTRTPVVLRRRVIETIGGMTVDTEDLVSRAAEKFTVAGDTA